MKDKPIAMVIILTIIATISSLILAGVFELTKDKIAEAYRKDFLKGLNVVFPSFDNDPDREVFQVDGQNVYPSKTNGKITGYAVQMTTPLGYSGDIEVLVGIGLDGKVSGIQILKHAETPGLGNKIEAQEFRGSFVGLGVKDNISVKKDGGNIDQFSGATISPRAVCDAVNKALKFVNEKVLEKK